MSRRGAEQAQKPWGQGSRARTARRLQRTGKVLFHIMKPRPVRIGLAGILLLGALAAVALYIGPARAERHVAQASLYGASDAKVRAAVQAAGWPQQESNWCGVATVAAIAQFRGHTVSQLDVANYMNSPQAVSEWGTPGGSATYWGPAFKADISGDDGTDPRSLAASLTGLAGTHPYHQMVELANNYNGTLHLVSDIIRTGEPISVIVFHGLHSVLVSGVVATDNPLSDPGSIVGLDVWDPGYGIPDGNIQGGQEVEVPLSTWLSSTYYWGSAYSANYYGSIAADPDPVVGTPYTYNPGIGDNGHLWIGHYVYIRPDASTDPAAGVSDDWAFSETGALIEGFHGEVPPGYTGPTTSIPVTTTLPDTSIDGPAFWSQSAYQLPSGSPMTVLGWTGTDSAHHLNVETSNDGFNYQNKTTLNETSFTRPSVIAVPAGSGSAVVIAWTGTDPASPSQRHLRRLRLAAESDIG